MVKGICCFSFIPMRKEPTETSEMVSQILFGETFTILEESKKWDFIELDFDGYLGWIDHKLSRIIDKQKLSWFESVNCKIANKPFFKVRQKNSDDILFVLAGSNFYNLHGREFSLFENSFQLNDPYLIYKQPNPANVIISSAELLLNIPYLWGGRSAFGIDCSGLAQTTFKIAGINMPRDASKQVNIGKTISSLENTLPGDLAFFNNEEGLITHVGILLSKNEIIHASGSVRIDHIDQQGIFDRSRQVYTHKLALIKRVFEND